MRFSKVIQPMKQRDVYERLHSIAREARDAVTYCSWYKTDLKSSVAAPTIIMLNPSVFPFLFRSFLSLALPPVASGLLLRWLRIDHWVIVLVAILSMPLACIMRIQWLLIRDRRAAVAIGATLAPTLQGQWPGNFDLAKRLIAARGDDSYLGKAFQKPFSQLKCSGFVSI